jgi:putative redox protein
MEITFPGGMAVEAHFKQFSVLTDQPSAYGGQNSAPAPFDLFLASLATCAGYYALRFCRERGLSTDGLKLALETEKDSEKHRLSKLRIAINLPVDFPEKYRQAIIRATGQCSVKRVILAPPEIEVTII